MFSASSLSALIIKAEWRKPEFNTDFYPTRLKWYQHTALCALCASIQVCVPEQGAVFGKVDTSVLHPLVIGVIAGVLCQKPFSAEKVKCCEPADRHLFDLRSVRLLLTQHLWQWGVKRKGGKDFSFNKRAHGLVFCFFWQGAVLFQQTRGPLGRTWREMDIFYLFFISRSSWRWIASHKSCFPQKNWMKVKCRLL